MAATAGSIAVGSTIGHGISHMLFGGSNEAAAPAQSAPVQQQQQYQSGVSCEVQAKGIVSSWLCIKMTLNISQISLSALKRPICLPAPGILNN